MIEIKKQKICNLSKKKLDENIQLFINEIEEKKQRIKLLPIKDR